MATTINLGKFHVGSTDRLQFTFTKDGSAWTGIDSVTLTFEKPDRSTTFGRSMSLSSGAVWYYDTTTADLDEAGSWTLGVTVVDGALTKHYPYEISLEVGDEP